MLVRAAHAPQKYFQRKQLEASALGMILHIDTLTRVTPSIESLLRPFAEGAYPGEISQQRRSLSLKISPHYSRHIWSSFSVGEVMDARVGLMCICSLQWVRHGI